MSLPALFSLIFATLLGLLPIFLLVGRRAVAARLRRRAERGQGESTAESPGSTAGDARGSQERGAVDSPRPGRVPDRVRASGSGDPAGESAILDRLIRARRAAAEPQRDVERMRLGNQRSESARIEGTLDASTRSRRSDGGSRIEARLGRLSLLQRAVVYRVILGPPVGLRAPGEREQY